MLVSPALLIGLMSLAGTAGWVAGWLLRRHRPPLLPDAPQGMFGAALCLEVYWLGGPLEHGLGELILVTLVGAWVAVGVAHATAVVIQQLVNRKTH
jgi:uncharacterized membrane protein YeaQ/YmgE (transglycosylase-associated protein family)